MFWNGDGALALAKARIAAVRESSFIYRRLDETILG
jgi:hypothetical protein